MANSKTIWRGQSATLTIGTIQDLSHAHIKSYTFDVINGSTSANGSFTGAGDGTGNDRVISTSAHVASGNTTGYTDYTVKGYLKYTHNSYSTQTVATSNKVDNSLRVQEPLDTESLAGFTISPTEVWSNLTEMQKIRIAPTKFNYTPFSKSVEVTCSQTVDAIGGGSSGAYPLSLTGTQNDYVEYQNNNANKDLGARTKNVDFSLYSIKDTSAATRALLYSKTLTVKNAVTGLNIPASLTAYNNATGWTTTQSVDYTPNTPYSKEVSLVYAEGDTAYDGNTININGITVSLNPDTGAFTFNVSNATNASLTSTFKFRVKSTQGQHSVFSNVMTFTALGFTPSRTVEVFEGETITIADLGFGTLDALGIPTNLEHVTVKKTSDNLGIEIKGRAVPADTTEEFVITSTNGSQVTITCKVKNIKDISRSINTGDTITITGQEIKNATTGITVKSISKITTSPAQGKGTAYVSSDGKLVYYAPATAVGNVPITVTTDTGASAVININVVAITMTIA